MPRHAVIYGTGLLVGLLWAITLKRAGMDEEAMRRIRLLIEYPSFTSSGLPLATYTKFRKIPDRYTVKTGA